MVSVVVKGTAKGYRRMGLLAARFKKQMTISYQRVLRRLYSKRWAGNRATRRGGEVPWGLKHLGIITSPVLKGTRKRVASGIQSWGIAERTELGLTDWTSELQLRDAARATKANIFKE